MCTNRNKCKHRGEWWLRGANKHIEANWDKNTIMQLSDNIVIFKKKTILSHKLTKTQCKNTFALNIYNKDARVLQNTANFVLKDRRNLFSLSKTTTFEMSKKEMQVLCQSVRFKGGYVGVWWFNWFLACPTMFKRTCFAKLNRGEQYEWFWYLASASINLSILCL